MLRRDPNPYQPQIDTGYKGGSETGISPEASASAEASRNIGSA